MVETTENYGTGGLPMVRIDGAKVRLYRERQGLTQLYVASVVQVTTETISRWENRRYPTIKKENAEKLAEALGVALDDLLEEAPTGGDGEAQDLGYGEGGAPPAAPQTPVPGRMRGYRLPLFLLLLLGGGWLGWFLFRTVVAVPPRIDALRILPGHVPPGQSFPVLIRIKGSAEKPLSLIVRELLPAGCRVLAADPQPTAAGREEGQLKWISRLTGGTKLVAYLLVSPESATYGRSLSFQGQVLVGGRGDRANPVSGDRQLLIGRYHWADTNGDNRIDDEEILRVYDLFGEVPAFSGLRDEVDTIWAAGGYHWDEATRQYVLEQ